VIVNDPIIVAEVAAAFAVYERALMANDLTALDALFWESGFTIRVGPGQTLYGIEAIRAFRIGRVGGSPRRTVFNTVITTFGEHFATAHTEFQREGVAAPGRQSQTWERYAEGWRVVSAHVSLLGEGN
jgi:hypothetical protein